MKSITNNVSMLHQLCKHQLVLGRFTGLQSKLGTLLGIQIPTLEGCCSLYISVFVISWYYSDVIYLVLLICYCDSLYNQSMVWIALIHYIICYFLCLLWVILTGIKLKKHSKFLEMHMIYEYNFVRLFPGLSQR